MTTDPYATDPPIPYDPEDPVVYPIEPMPPPERVHLTVEEAIAYSQPHVEPTT